MKTVALGLTLFAALASAADTPRIRIVSSPQGDLAQEIIELKRGPRLGVTLAEVDEDAVKRLNLREERGALVTSVAEGSAAEKAGIKRDDVIVKFQGDNVGTAGQLTRLVRENPAGRTVTIEVMRGGSSLTLKAKLESPDSERGLEWKEDLREQLGELKNNLRGGAHAFRFGENGDSSFHFFTPDESVIRLSNRGRLGITYQEIEGQLAEYFKAPGKEGILVTGVSPGSAAEKAGMKAGDVLVKLDGVTVRDAGDLRQGIRELADGKAATATVIRNGQSVDLSVTIEKKEPLTRRKGPTT